MADQLKQSDPVILTVIVMDADGVEHRLLDKAAMTWQYVTGLVPAALDKAHQQAEANVMAAIRDGAAEQIAAALAPIEAAQTEVAAQIVKLSR